MHSIERYGIVALLFLVVTVVAVLMWDGGKKAKEPAPPVAGLAPAADAVGPGRPRAPEPERRLSLAAESQPGPLQRRPRAAERAADAGQAPGAQPLEALAADASPTELREEPDRAPAAPEPQPEGVPLLAAGAVAPLDSGRTYTVRAGDTLSEIAQRELGSARRWQELVAANPGLDPSRLHVGRKLRVPGAASGAPASAVPATASTAGAESRPAAREAAAPARGGKTWKVGPGESLWRIAEKALGDGKRWREIAALNPKVNPDRLSAGTVLVLPDSARGQSTPARTAPAPKTKSEASPTVVASSKGSERQRTGGRVR